MGAVSGVVPHCVDGEHGQDVWVPSPLLQSETTPQKQTFVSNLGCGYLRLISLCSINTRYVPAQNLSSTSCLAVSKPRSTMSVTHIGSVSLGSAWASLTGSSQTLSPPVCALFSTLPSVLFLLSLLSTPLALSICVLCCGSVPASLFSLHPLRRVPLSTRPCTLPCVCAFTSCPVLGRRCADGDALTTQGD
eukprot:406995-Rhodomonas_salina.2